ncbi:hypothetical protein [Streptomyces nigra]|uniref:hypothetical protein n=1 Tax=Streptomyces nigra TaxID=1827580 RepID=UPI00369717E5
MKVRYHVVAQLPIAPAAVAVVSQHASPDRQEFNGSRGFAGNEALTRRPAHRISPIPQIPGSLRLTAVAAAFLSLVAGLSAMARGIGAWVALPAMTLAPLLAEHLPARWDARAREHVRTVEGAAACRQLQRLAAVHTCLVQAAAGSDRHELRRSAEIGRQLLWDAADLLHRQDTPLGLLRTERP